MRPKRPVELAPRCLLSMRGSCRWRLKKSALRANHSRKMERAGDCVRNDTVVPKQIFEFQHVLVHLVGWWPPGERMCNSHCRSDVLIVIMWRSRDGSDAGVFIFCSVERMCSWFQLQVWIEAIVLLLMCGEDCSRHCCCASEESNVNFVLPNTLKDLW